MKPAIGYRQLDVWCRSMELCEMVYAITLQLPQTQRFSLADQLQRAAVSIPSNIAEGHAKRSSKDYHRHLKIAAGSLAELETQLELCVRLGFVDREAVRLAWNEAQVVARMLSRLIQSIAARKSERSKLPNAQRPKPNAS